MQVKLDCIGISIFRLSFPRFMIAQQSLDCGAPAPLWITPENWTATVFAVDETITSKQQSKAAQERLTKI